ncbi:MAG: protein adenylyltransferase SelO family protein, partial [Acidobacteriota bacterium]
MRVGFVHGVMNTDNMSILGLTIDYGPYGWLDNYDPNWTPNTTDAGGRRYRYDFQPQIAHWNLARFAEAIYPLIEDVEALEQTLEVFPETFDRERRVMMAQKLGLEKLELEPSGNEAAADGSLVEELLDLLSAVETDMTIFYRRLADVPTWTEASEDDLLAPLQEAYYDPEQLSGAQRERTVAWLRRYVERVRKDDMPGDVRRASMNAVNPKYVLRNYIAQLAIDKAEQGDGSLVQRLLDVLRRPYDEQPEAEEFFAKRPEWARHRPGCSMLSCSS